MPIFEFVCRKCNNPFETIVFNSSNPKCPSCGGENLEKQFSVFAVGGDGASALRETPGPCGTCGDPRGAGSCSI